MFKSVGRFIRPCGDAVEGLIQNGPKCPPWAGADPQSAGTILTRATRVSRGSLGYLFWLCGLLWVDSDRYDKRL
jgi:hypothetical protein